MHHSTNIKTVYYSLPVRLLVVFSYLSIFIFDGFFVPVALYFIFRYHRFIRYHAFVAIVLHVCDWLFSGLLKLPSYFFVFELDQAFITPEEFAGKLFSEDQTVTLSFIFLLSGLFYFILLVLAGMQKKNSRFVRNSHNQTELMRMGLYTIILVPGIFYLQGLWGSNVPGNQTSFLALQLHIFENPARLIPGHLILLGCMLFSIYTLRSRRLLLAPFTSLYIWLQRSQHQRGAKRYKQVRWRNFILPGWGQLYEGHIAAGLATIFAFTLGVLFFWISVGMAYGKLVADIPFLNANFGWYFLGQLGLKSHGLSDRAFMNLFAHPGMIVLLITYLFICYSYAWWDARRQYLGQGQSRFLRTVSLGLLLHLTPLGIVFLIPVTVNPFPMLVQALGGLAEPDDTSQAKEPVQIMPELYVSNDTNRPATEYYSGEDGKGLGNKHQNDLSAQNENPIKQKTKTENHKIPKQKTGETITRAKKESRQKKLTHQEDADQQQKKGKRQEQNYSSYLAIKIRTVEKGLHYWQSIPRPYSSVVEYSITRDGRVHSVGLLQASEYPEADEKTLTLIRRIDPVLSPPGGKALHITELFWNTKAGDQDLPTDLQRKLSRLFDGRLIKEVYD